MIVAVKGEGSMVQKRGSWVAPGALLGVSPSFSRMERLVLLHMLMKKIQKGRSTGRAGVRGPSKAPRTAKEGGRRGGRARLGQTGPQGSLLSGATGVLVCCPLGTEADPPETHLSFPVF